MNNGEWEAHVICIWIELLGRRSNRYEWMNKCICKTIFVRSLFFSNWFYAQFEHIFFFLLLLWYDMTYLFDVEYLSKREQSTVPVDAMQIVTPPFNVDIASSNDKHRFVLLSSKYDSLAISRGRRGCIVTPAQWPDMRSIRRPCHTLVCMSARVHCTCAAVHVFDRWMYTKHDVVLFYSIDMESRTHTHTQQYIHCVCE